MKPHELIADKKRWCIGMWAQDVEGFSVPIDDINACAWCMGGAASKCAGLAFNKAWMKLYDFCRDVFGKHPNYVNDNYGHAIAVETLRLCFKDERQC